MNNLVKKVRDYVKDILGEISDGHQWDIEKVLPYFLQEQYQFYCIEIFDKKCLLMINQQTKSDSPAVIKKHWNSVTSHFKGVVIYIIETTNSFTRKQYIEQKLPFIVPGNQLYLPMMGLDLREYYRSGYKTDKPYLSAVAHVLLLRYILGKYTKTLSARKLAESLAYSPMTLTRAINDLENRDLASSKMIGREKHLIFNVKAKELWLKALPYLQSPIKKTIWIAKPRNKLTACLAGVSALSQLTMVVAPKAQIYAIYTNEWLGIKSSMGLNECSQWEENAIQLQLWRYKPDLLIAEQLCERVDIFSLWLSLKHLNDERIEMSLDKKIEDYWSNYL